VLIRNYEDEHYDFDEDNIRPLDALKSLMEANDMSTKDLSELIGTQSGASMILTGKRPISAPQALRLAKRFKVDVGLFLQGA
jgi:antitoxin component HigA of HigAB toxin-antitoxin module